MDQLIIYVLDNWQTILNSFLALLTGGGLIALIVQSIKHKWNFEQRLRVWGMQVKKFTFLLPAFFSALFASADAIIQNGTAIQQWFPPAAKIMPLLMLAALAVHRFAVSPLYQRIHKFLGEVAEYKASKEPVSAPMTVPTPNPVPELPPRLAE